MTISFARHQFPPEVIRHAVWLYVRFTLSYRDVEDLLAERGLDVSYETATVGLEVRAIVRSRTSPSTPSAHVAMASRRDGRDDCGPAVLAVARG
jgi:transposase-like protein